MNQTANNQDLLYKLALTLVPGVGGMLTRQLVSYCGSAEAVFKVNKSKLLSIPNIGEHLANQLSQKEVLQKAETILIQAQKSNTKIIFYTDSDFPIRLKRVPDAPAIMYVQGNVNLEQSKTISIIGTREPSNYGKEMVDKIVNDLAPFNPLIISGLAYGIDIHAHKAAIKVGLPTLAVMGSGIDIIYPAIHKNTAQQMLENGGIITERTFGEKPVAMNFPARNRIIAGLSDAVIVIESGVKGGTLITADIANGYNIDVFAVPGNINNPMSIGCNQLIRDNKAQIYTGIADLEKGLNWDMENILVKKVIKPRPVLEETESLIYSLLEQFKDIHIDELSYQSNIPLNKIASVLLNMEFAGLVKVLPGKIFSLVK